MSPRETKTKEAKGEGMGATAAPQAVAPTHAGGWVEVRIARGAAYISVTRIETTEIFEVFRVLRFNRDGSRWYKVIYDDLDAVFDVLSELVSKLQIDMVTFYYDKSLDVEDILFTDSGYAIVTIDFKNSNITIRPYTPPQKKGWVPTRVI